MSAFGNFILPSDIEDAVRDRLQTWMPDYLRYLHAARRPEKAAYAPVRSWTLASDEADRFPEEQLPGVLIAWTDGAIQHRGDGAGTELDMQIYALVQGQNFANARELACVYAFALWAICEQQLVGLPISGVDVFNVAIRSGRTPGEGETRRWRASGLIELTLTADGMVDPNLGPAVPTDPGSTDPPPDYPEVDDVVVDVVTD